MNKYEMLENSIDVRQYRFELIVSSVIALFLTLFTVTMGMALDNGVFFAYTFIYLAVFIPLIAWYVYKLYTVKRDPDRYEHFYGYVSESHLSWNRTFYFVLDVTDGFGRKFSVKTNAVFAASVLSERYYGEFYKKKLDVLYDKTNDRAVVVGINER